MFLLLGLFFFAIQSVYYYEPFDVEALNTRWIPSKNANFPGTWGLEGRTADLSNGTIVGLVSKTAAARHAISAKNEISALGDTFVLQYENKIQSTSFGCGGSYIKLLNEAFEPLSFDNTSPYVIMFGPDKCVDTNQIQFIYRTQNPLSKIWSEHKLVTKIPGLYDNITHVYTLVLHQNDTFQIKVDNVVKTSGSLHDSSLFETPFEPPKTIPDSTEKKPADWVDAEEIPDPTDFKPADWDELAPQTIPDPLATKPADWKEDEALEIPDPNSVKPASWNEEEDGPFQPGVISNPYCVDHGCGTWTPPQIKNPAYKGKWKAKQIPNPLYKGKWKPRDVENPFYYTPNATLHQVGKIYGVGFELVSATSQWFGNVFVGDSVTEAEGIATQRWKDVNAQEIVTKQAYDAEQAAKAKAEAEAKKAADEAKKAAEEKAKAEAEGYDPTCQSSWP